jgi:hypothetical protein
MPLPAESLMCMMFSNEMRVTVIMLSVTALGWRWQ